MRFDNVTFEASFGTAAQLPPSDIPEIAFSGRSNVGKSSLLNKILGRKSLARVSSSPGKTATVNFYRLSDVRLADLPGYGYAKVSGSEQARWSALMEYYFNSERNIKLVLQLIDMRHSPTVLDLQMIDFLKQTGYPFAVVLTKSDKLNATNRKERLEKLPGELNIDSEPIPFSALKKEGVEEIKQRIEMAVADEKDVNEDA